jgi:hypothetical protein
MQEVGSIDGLDRRAPGLLCRRGVNRARRVCLGAADPELRGGGGPSAREHRVAGSFGCPGLQDGEPVALGFSSVLATAMVQIPWTLRFIYEQVPNLRVHADWPPFAEQQEGLLLWEAFVSGAGKGETHEDDARSGVQAFCEQLPNPGDPSAAETERPFSVVATAAIWAGFDLPVEDTRSGCLLVRATHPPDLPRPLGQAA